MASEECPSEEDVAAAVSELRVLLGGRPMSPALVRVGKWLAANTPGFVRGAEPSLQSQRAALERDRWKGARCPVCDQGVRVYKRPLYGSQMRGLIRVYSYFERPDAAPWIHLTDYLKEWKDVTSQGGDMARLSVSVWGLLERQPGTRGDGSTRVGYYRITELGRRFVQGAVAVPAYHYSYNDTVLPYPQGETPPQVTIQDVVGDEFDYRALLDTTRPRSAL